MLKEKNFMRTYIFGTKNTKDWAPRKTRAINYFIDSCTITGGFYIIQSLFIVKLGLNLRSGLILFAWIFLYYFILESIFWRTLGKLFTKSRVLTLYYEKPNILAIALRTSIRFVPFEPISILREGMAGETCWHDDWSNTRVIIYI